MKDQEQEENTYTKNDKNPRIHFLADSFKRCLKSQPQSSQALRRHKGQASPRRTDSPALSSLTPTEPGGEKAGAGARASGPPLAASGAGTKIHTLLDRPWKRCPLLSTNGAWRIPKLHPGEDRSETHPPCWTPEFQSLATRL